MAERTEYLEEWDGVPYRIYRSQYRQRNRKWAYEVPGERGAGEVYYVYGLLHKVRQAARNMVDRRKLPKIIQDCNEYSMARVIMTICLQHLTRRSERTGKAEDFFTYEFSINGVTGTFKDSVLRFDDSPVCIRNNRINWSSSPQFVDPRTLYMMGEPTPRYLLAIAGIFDDTKWKNTGEHLQSLELLNQFQRVT